MCRDQWKKQPFEHAGTLAEKIIDDWAGSCAANDDQVEMLRQALKQTKIIAVAHHETTNAHLASAWSPDNIGGTAMTACHIFEKAKGGGLRAQLNELSASRPGKVGYCSHPEKNETLGVCQDQHRNKPEATLMVYKHFFATSKVAPANASLLSPVILVDVP